MILVEGAKGAVPSSYKRAWKPGMPELHRLVHASGLAPADFRNFASVFDLQGKSGSRFAIEEHTLKAISEWSDIELCESASRLREYIRKRMLPEAAGEIITREKILIQLLGVSDDYALFPCSSKIRPITSSVPRAIASEIVDRMTAGTKHVCMHGAGGVGKTTTLQQIEEALPTDSVMIVYDCYGAGSYLDSSELRHRPQDAFVQLANEITQRLRLPFFLVPSGTRDYPRAFRKRLESSAAAMAATAPGALLLVAVDAADNSVLAAQSRSPAEVSFVHDIVTMEQLPSNVRILVSARTGRLDELHLPNFFEKIALPAFSHAETAGNVARFWQASPAWVDDFHHLSGGVPRVQAYAFENAATSSEMALEALRPNGKSLDQVFREQFNFALRKSARVSDIEEVCAGLITLPRPIPLTDLAAVLELPESTIIDICGDLAPGVRTTHGSLSFADEDFESFIREAAGVAISRVRMRTAEHFMLRAQVDAYAALNVAPALLDAGRGKELLELVEREPEPAAEVVPDPIRRREVQLQRLQSAIRVCREAEDPAHALRFVLIGAEAIKTEESTIKLLVDNPALTARYARDTASRIILGNPKRVSDHGPLLFHMLAEDAARSDAISVREGRRRLHAWEIARREQYEDNFQQYGHASPWRISPSEIAEAMYARLMLEGPASAVALFRRLQSRVWAYLGGRSLVSRLLAEGRVDLVDQVAALLPAQYALFVLVPLAMTGRAVDQKRLAVGLQRLKRRTGLRADMLARADIGDSLGLWIIDTAIAAAEILLSACGDASVALTVLDPFLDLELRRVDKLNESRVALLDAIFRAVTIVDAMAGATTAPEKVFTPRPAPLTDETNKKNHDNNAINHDRQLGELSYAFVGVYAARARLLLAQQQGLGRNSESLVEARQRLEQDSWRFESRYFISSMRSKASESLAILLATDIPPTQVMESALAIRQGWSSREAGTLFDRLASVSELHDALVTGIAEAAKAVHTQRIGSEERSNTLVTYARLLAAVSPSDADVIFNLAVTVAGELDIEVMDQLHLIAQMVKQSHDHFGVAARATAAELCDVLYDAAIRLDGYDHFPWHDAVNAVALLDFSTALAAVARWDDSDIVGLSRVLGVVVTAGLQTKTLPATKAAAMIGLVPYVADDVLRRVFDEAEGEGGETADRIAEEFSRDILLERLSVGDSLQPFLLRHCAGYWARRLLHQSSFTQSLPGESTESAQSADSAPSGNAAPPSRHSDWDEFVLTNAEKLREEVLRRLDQSRGSERFLSATTVISDAGDQVSARNRIAHLDALMKMDKMWDDDDVFEVIVSRLNGWSSSPAVMQWQNRHLPSLFASRLPALCRYLPHHDRQLRTVIAMVKSTLESTQDVMLHGVERNIDQFSASSAFGLVGVIAEQLQGDEVAELCGWYIRRLLARIDVSAREGVSELVLPVSSNEALARFFYAFLGDVDVRMRWRCTHALRRLARLQDRTVISAIASEYARSEEPAFRKSGAPFYWVAARLWFVVAMDRIALESPDIASDHGMWLQTVALDESFPHMLVREFARDAYLKLIATKRFSINGQTAKALAMVNQSPLPRAAKARDYGDSLRSINKYEEGLRFRFDSMDTLPYWYDPMLSAFSDLPQREFLLTVERWIVDQWGVGDETSARLTEPRKHRFERRDWNLRSNSHGSHPTLEDFRTYLEWHAMWCATGQLLQTCQLAAPRYGEDQLESRLKYNKLTAAPFWLSDLVAPRPLQEARWRRPDAVPTGWLETVSHREFMVEVFASDLPDYIIVNAHIDDQFQHCHQQTRVSTGLASPNTAHALVRALQTVLNSSDFYICPEDHDLEIDESGFKLTGWLSSLEGDTLLDEKDLFRNGVRRIEYGPGKFVTKLLELEQRFQHGIYWVRKGQEIPSFIYEAWGVQENDSRRGHYEDNIVGSSGHRLLIRRNDLAEFLKKKKRDLIVEVEITRRERRSHSYSDDPEDSKENEFERILLFRRDGSIQAAERDLGTWRSPSP